MESSEYRFGEIRVDAATKRVFRGEEGVPLEPKSLLLLLYLIENRGRLVSKEELLQVVWPGTFVGDNALTRAVAQIRKTLGDNAKQCRYIETVPKLGYRFIGELANQSNAGPVTAVLPAPASKSRIWIWAAAALLTVLGGAAAAWTFLRAPVAHDMPRPVPFTTYRGSELQPAFSPDGSRVAFQWNGENEDNPDIYVKALGSETPLRLTTDPAPDGYPAWSQDGSSIAFIRLRSQHEFDLMAVPSLGGAERKLGQFHWAGEWNASPTWSPDSKWVVVPAMTPALDRGQLMRVSIETGEVDVIVDSGPALQPRQPSVSPDGSTLLFTTGPVYDTGDLFVARIDARMTPLEPPHKIALDIKVTGGRWISSQEILVNSAKGAYRIPLAGTRTPEVVPWIPSAIPVGVLFDISPQAHRLVYSLWKGDTNIWGIDLDETGLAAKGASPRRVIASTFRDACPQYAPDGGRIAFYSNRSGSLQVWMANAAGEQAHQLTFVPHGSAGAASWSPDGRRLALDSDMAGRWQIYVMSPEGGKMTRLAGEQFDGFGPSWSRDGHWLYFGSTRSGSQEIWKVPADGGAPVQVSRNGGTKAHQAADGKTLYFSKETESGSIWELTAEGRETQIADSLFRSNFAVSHRGVYYMTAPQSDGHAALKFFDFVTRRTVTILPIGRPEFGLDISPDGRVLVYAQLDDVTSDLMMVENFR